MNDVSNILDREFNTIEGIFDDELASLVKNEKDIKKILDIKSQLLKKKYGDLFKYTIVRKGKELVTNTLDYSIPCTLKYDEKKQGMRIYVGKYGILNTICHSVNIDIEKIFYKDEKETYKAFREEVRRRITEIKNIKDEEDLIRLDFISDEIYKKLKQAPKHISQNAIKDAKENRIKLYTNILFDIKYLYEKTNDIDITDNIDKYIDPEKFALWLAGISMYTINIQFDNIKNKENKEESLTEGCKDLFKFVIDYHKFLSKNPKYKNNYEKKVLLSLKVSENNKRGLYSTTDFTKEYTEFYKRYLFENEDIDDELLSMMAEIPPKDMFVDWEILPSTSNINKENSYIQNNHNITNQNKLQTTGKLKVSKDEIYKKKKELLEEKITFFSSTVPIIKIKGTNKMKGYYGYVYRNGNVIFEKYYEDIDNYVPAINEAIYVMNIHNFMELSKLSKSEIIEYIKENKSSVRRIYHSKNWKEKIIRIIKEKTTITKDNVTEMFKKLSEQKNIEGLKELRENLSPSSDNTKPAQKIKTN